MRPRGATCWLPPRPPVLPVCFALRSALPRTSQRAHRDPPLLASDVPEEAARRPPPAHRRHAVARPGDGRRPVAGRAAREAAGARPLLGHGLRLAQGRGEAQRPAAVHDRDRRRRHPLHPRPLASSERPAADHDAWLARLGVRAAQDHRSADRSRRRTADARRTPSTSSCRRCRATASPASRPARAGIPTASPAPGRS